MAIKAQDFLKSEIDGTNRLFLVSGEEEFFREKAIERFKAGLPEDVEVSILDAMGEVPIEARDLLDDLCTKSLFGGERLIHLRNADKFITEHGLALTRFLSEGEVLHFFILEGESIAPKSAKSGSGKGIAAAFEKAGGIVVACDTLYDTPFGGKGPPSQSVLSRWVQDQARSLGKSLSMDDAYLLHRLAGTGLRELDSELRKIVLVVKERRTITAEDIESVVGAGRLAAVFEAADTFARKDGLAVLEQSSQLFERGMSDFSGRVVTDQVSIALALTSAISGKLRKVGQVRDLLADGESFETAAKAIKQSPFFMDRLRVQVEAWKSRAELVRAHEVLRSLERDLKSGGPARVLVDRAIVVALGVSAKAPKGLPWRK